MFWYQEYSTSIVQPLKLWKLGVRAFLALKYTSTTSTTVKMALSDILSTETGVHKHRTTSTLVETEFRSLVSVLERSGKVIFTPVVGPVQVVLACF